VLADIYGRKATILLSAVLFVGTSICGAMPSLAWNIGMCFMMGLAAGGMLPVTYALLAEMMPNRHRGWSLVLVGGLGAGGGYFAASGRDRAKVFTAGDRGSMESFAPGPPRRCLARVARRATHHSGFCSRRAIPAMGRGNSGSENSTQTGVFE